MLYVGQVLRKLHNAGEQDTDGDAAGCSHWYASINHRPPFCALVSASWIGYSVVNVAGYPGRTHRFVSEPVLFEFGAGLHYTNFSTELRCADTIVSLVEARMQLERTRRMPHLAPPIIVPSMTVSNTGRRRSDYTVLLFLSPPDAGRGGRPVQQLRQFQRVATVSGGTAEIKLPLTCHDFALANQDGTFEIASGTWTLRVDESELRIRVG